MQTHTTIPKPPTWAEFRKARIATWAAPFYIVEWVFEWIAHSLSNWRFLQVLHYLRTFGILVAVIFYFSESGDRLKQKHYQAWQVINTAQGKGGNGGRLDALQELNEDRVPLVGVDVSGAFLQGLLLEKANLARANLERADLRAASLRRAKLDHANLTGAVLRHASLAEVSVEGAILTGCEIYGIAAWNLRGTPKDQSNLIIRATPEEPAVSVDDLEVAQFVYLLLHNEKIRSVIDTVGRKAVLILGRFTAERKAVLDALRAALRGHCYLAMLFDFDAPGSRDLTETIVALAHMSRFIIADLTDPRSVPQELTAIIPDLPSVPVVPVVLAAQKEYAMFEHWKRYPWVLPILRYKDGADLLARLQKSVIDKAERKAQRQTGVSPAR